MSSRIIIPSAPAAGGRVDTTPPASAYDLPQKIHAALVCGVCAGGIVLVVISIVFLLGGFWKRWLWGVAVAAVVGLLVACGLAFWWAWLAACRAWRVDDREIARRYKREDAELARLKAAVEAAKRQVRDDDDQDGDPTTFTDEQRLDWVALKILERAYMTGEPATRDAMEADRVCTQGEWNLANKAMKALGLKKGYTMQPADFGAAWALWREGVKIEADEEGALYLWYLKSDGRFHALERLA